MVLGLIVAKELVIILGIKVRIVNRIVFETRF